MFFREKGMAYCSAGPAPGVWGPDGFCREARHLPSCKAAPFDARPGRFHPRTDTPACRGSRRKTRRGPKNQDAPRRYRGSVCSALLGSHSITSVAIRNSRESLRQAGPQSLQALPCSPSIPSFAMIGTMMRPAAGSAHQKPNKALSSNPARRIAER